MNHHDLQQSVYCFGTSEMNIMLGKDRAVGQGLIIHCSIPYILAHHLFHTYILSLSNYSESKGEDMAIVQTDELSLDTVSCKSPAVWEIAEMGYR